MEYNKGELPAAPDLVKGEVLGIKYEMSEQSLWALAIICLQSGLAENERGVSLVFNIRLQGNWNMK